MKKKWMNQLAALVCALALTLPGLLTPASAATPSFPDVKPGDWFYSNVTELAQLGGVHGYPDGTFRPNATISRAEVASIAVNLFPPDVFIEGNFPAGFPEEIEQMIGEKIGANHWAKHDIAQAMLCYVKIEPDPGVWDQPATRADIAHILVKIYVSAMYGLGKIDLPTNIPGETVYLIGDYETFKGTEADLDICWLYSEGIVSGVNARGDYNPNGNATRAECCKIVDNLLHPEKRKQVDWGSLGSGGGDGFRYEKDFTGKDRIRFVEDVAFDYCRALEEQIGIQIFYNPGEWTQKADGLFSYSDQADAALYYGVGEYYKAVLAELKKMKAAFDLYPAGFLKEMAQKKGSRGAEIILCPYSLDGTVCHGIYLYDESSDAKKVDQVYYSGTGDSQYYSHEMGHMVTSAVAILNGFNATCSTWDSFGKGNIMSYISGYAMTSRAEDWAETWAYLWHQPQFVIESCEDADLRAKVQYLTQILDKHYSTFHPAQTPWASVLN